MDIDVPLIPEIDIDDKMNASIENNEILNFDIWLTCVTSCLRQRLMTCVLGGKYGYSKVTFLDNIESQSLDDGTTFNKGRGVAGGKGDTTHQKSINDYFEKSLEQSSLVYDDLNLGLSRGNSRGNSRGSLNNDNENYGDNNMSPGKDEKIDKKRKLFSELNGDSLVSDFNNQMNDRFSSTERMDNSYIDKQKILTSQTMANFSNISTKKHSSFSNLPLPPIRLQYINTLEKKRKMLMKSGYDEAFGRATPRCLRNESSNNPVIASGFGG
jgi:hypothetical protein